MSIRTKKILIIVFILLGILSSKSFAIENNEEKVMGETFFSIDDYYKYNEELHNEKFLEKNYYRNDVNTMSLKDYIIQESLACPEAIDISAYQIPVDDVEKILVPVLYYDELFYINGFSYDYLSSTNEVMNIYFSYTLTTDEIQNAWNVINNEVKKYEKGIKSEWNELEKVLYTNNFLCQTCEYATDTTIITTHTLYGALVSKEPVCDGYSHAFRYLLNQVGIEATIATSTSMNHAWNLVNIDDEYYHIDVTWNDTLYNGVRGVGITAYEFFLASDDSFKNERKSAHTDWVADVKATSTKYDGTQDWRNQTNYLIYKDNYWYFINKLSDYSFELNKLDLRKSNIEKTLVNTNTIEDYMCFAPGLTTDGENLYYSTFYKIFKMDYNGENISEFFTLLDNSKCIYSVEIINNVFYYDTFNIESDGSISGTTRKTNICDEYKVEEPLVYTTISTREIDEKNVMIFSNPQKISDLLVASNFPVIDQNYIIEVYIEDKVKLNTDQIGSKNIIKIFDNESNLVAEYTTILKGDVNGDGYVKMYDAFQILRDIILGRDMVELERLIRDYNDDGILRMYDAFSFLRYSLFN